MGNHWGHEKAIYGEREREREEEEEHERWTSL